MCLQSLMNFQHCLFKILRKNQNVMDRHMDRQCVNSIPTPPPPPPKNIRFVRGIKAHGQCENSIPHPPPTPLSPAPNIKSSKRCHFVRKYFYCINHLHANVQCVHIVYTKYQDVSVKAVELVKLPVYALPMHH